MTNSLKIPLELHTKVTQEYKTQRKVQFLIRKVFKPQTSEEKFLGEISHWL